MDGDEVEMRVAREEAWLKGIDVWPHIFHGYLEHGDLKGGYGTGADVQQLSVSSSLRYQGELTTRQAQLRIWAAMLREVYLPEFAYEVQ